MKKLILSIFLLLFSVIVINAQVKTIYIHGQVTNLNGGFPVSGHPVHIMTDSASPVFNYYNTVTTDNYGFYGDSITIPNNSQILFHVKTFDCLNILHNIDLLTTNPPLIANFQICDSTNNSCSAIFIFVNDTLNPFAFSFIDLSSGNPNQWFWDFGDGNTSVLQSPNHTYNSPGTYHVCLTIVNNDSLNYCTSTYCEYIIIDSISTCYANFYYLPSTIPMEYQFYDDSSPNIGNRLWDFEDGYTSHQKNPTHLFPDTGWYNVCLTVSKGIPGTSSYCEDTYCDSVFVNIFNTPCDADFIYSIHPLAPLTLHFANIAGLNTYKYMWDFGDGNFSNDSTPVHTYTSHGNYHVCLTVYHIIPGTTDTLCTDTHCEYINLPPTTFYNIAGQVFANFFPTDMCDIYLYSVMNNGDILLSDTTSIDTIGVYFFYQVPAGNYIIKIVPQHGNPVFGQLLPTYYGDAYHWINANVIHLDTNFYSANVNLQPYQTLSGGSGAISGNISFDGGKFNDKGIPAPNVEVLLLDMQFIPIQLEYTEQNGSFKYDNLPFGTYLVYPEIAGKHTSPVQVTIDINNPVVTDINLVITQNSVIASLKDNLPDNIESISDIYPNPSIDMGYIDLNVTRTSNIEFRILNHIGQIINIKEETLLTGENRITVNTSKLSSGLYILQIVNDDKSIIPKKFLKIE